MESAYLFGVALVLSPILLSLSCSSNDHLALPPAISGDASSPHADASASDDGTAASDTGVADTGVDSSGSLAVTDGGVCGTLAPTTLVTQQQVAQPSPTPTGGAITPGTYLLTEMNKYTGVGGATGPTSKIEATALALDATSYARAVAFPAGDAGALGLIAIDSGHYTATGTSFAPSATCGIGFVTVSYSATPTEVRHLFVGEEYVYTKQ
ncbi:MAG: hypothetical protein ACHREM_03785 [Polyangiales bacterium]